MLNTARMFAAASLTALAALSAAATEPAARTFEAMVELELGTSTHIDDAGFVLEFFKVLEDSRCPITSCASGPGMRASS